MIGSDHFAYFMNAVMMIDIGSEVLPGCHSVVRDNGDLSLNRASSLTVSSVHS